MLAFLREQGFQHKNFLCCLKCLLSFLYILKILFALRTFFSLPFLHFEDILLSCLLICIIINKKPIVILIFVPLCNMTFLLFILIQMSPFFFLPFAHLHLGLALLLSGHYHTVYVSMGYAYMIFG